MLNVHYGHIFHLSGSPKITETANALVSIPDGALVVGDDGKIAYAGEKADLPSEYASAKVHNHRGGFLLPGFVDTHVHFPQTFAVDSYGGGQLLEWLNLCIFPSEAKYADPEFARRSR
jgi:guanine deaminase